MNKRKTTYQSPELEVIGICAENIICQSGENVTVADPVTPDDVEW